MLCPTDSPFSIAPAQIYTDKNKTKMQWIILSSLLYIICHFMFLLRSVMSLEQYQCNLNMFCIGASSLHLASLPWLFKLTFSTVCLAPNLDLSRFQPLFLLCPPLDRLFFFFFPSRNTYNPADPVDQLSYCRGYSNKISCVSSHKNRHNTLMFLWKEIFTL